jgi:hypothetical protein
MRGIHGRELLLDRPPPRQHRLELQVPDADLEHLLAPAAQLEQRAGHRLLRRAAGIPLDRIG